MLIPWAPNLSSSTDQRLPATDSSSTPSTWRCLPLSALQFPYPEPPVSALEGDQCLEVVSLSEVGPQRVREEELRVRRLPKQEVAQPQLAAGSDEQVGVMRELVGMARLELIGEQRFVDVLRLEQLVVHLLCKVPARLHYVPPPAVADCQCQVELGVIPCGLLGFSRGLLKRNRQS